MITKMSFAILLGASTLSYQLCQEIPRSTLSTLLLTNTSVGLFQQSLRDRQDVVPAMTPWIVAEQRHLTGFGTGLTIIDILWHPLCSFAESFTRDLLGVDWDLWASVLLQMSIIKART